MSKTRGPYSAWALAVTYAALIFFLSSLSQPLPEPVENIFSDWFLHGVEYGLFGWLLMRAFYLSLPASGSFWLWAGTLVLGTLYGISDEWHQSFVPHRKADGMDVLKDAIGIAAGSYTWLMTQKKIIRK